MNKVLIFLCVSALTLSSVSLAMKNSEDQGKELCHAAKCGNHELVQKLFAQGAHVDARGENGATALMHAAY
jgi:ankyrin repeat protein